MCLANVRSLPGSVLESFHDDSFSQLDIIYLSRLQRINVSTSFEHIEIRSSLINSAQIVKIGSSGI